MAANPSFPTTPPHAQEHYNFDKSGEHVVRHGSAAPVRERRPLKYAGRLDTPRLWLDPKKASYQPTDATLEVGHEKGTLSLILDEQQELHDEVSGSLTDAPELTALKINGDHRYSLDDLISLLKFNRYRFPDLEVYKRVFASLRSFSAKVQTTIESTRNNDGSSKSSLEREVNGIEWEREFILKVPVFKGYPTESFRVEIGIEPTSASVKFFLDSPELIELRDDLKRRLLEDEIKYFTDWGCSLIHVA